MSKYVKELMTAQIAAKVKGVEDLFVVSYAGIDANEMVRLRSDFRKVDVSLMKIKNSMADRAFSRVGMKEAGKLLDGPCALALGGGSVIQLAKAVHEYARKNKKFALRGGVVEGRTIGPETVEALARIPSKEALMAQVIGVVQAPMRNVVSVIHALLQKTAGLLGAYREKLEAGGGAGAAASEG